jgi:hypothetical protein
MRLRLTVLKQEYVAVAAKASSYDAHVGNNPGNPGKPSFLYPSLRGEFHGNHIPNGTVGS